MTADLKRCRHPSVTVCGDGIWRCEARGCEAEWETVSDWKVQHENDDHERIVELTEEVAKRDAEVSELNRLLKQRWIEHNHREKTLVERDALLKQMAEALRQASLCVDLPIVQSALAAYDGVVGK